MGDPEKARARAREEYAQLSIRIRAQEKLVRDLKHAHNQTTWDDARRQLKKLKAKQQDVLRRMM